MYSLLITHMTKWSLSLCQDFREAVGAAVGDEGDPVLEEERLREILNKLPDVYTLHRRILTELENRIRQWWDTADPTPHTHTHTQPTHTVHMTDRTHINAAQRSFIRSDGPCVCCTLSTVSSVQSLVFLHPIHSLPSGKRARGLRMSSYPGSWSLRSSRPTLVTTTAAWACWTKAAGPRLPSQPSSASMRSDSRAV